MLPLALVAFIAAGCGGPPAETESAPPTPAAVGDLAGEQQAIQTLLEKQTRAFFERSFEGEEEVWAHEPYVVRMVDTGELDVGWDGISTQYRTFMQENPTPVEDLQFTHENVHLQIHGDGAWVVFEQHLTANLEGEPISYDSREVRFLARIDGEWKIVYQYSADLSPEEGSPDE
jgi:ketosteroid isomerase-like protein